MDVAADDLDRETARVVELGATARREVAQNGILFTSFTDTKSDSLDVAEE